MLTETEKITIKHGSNDLINGIAYEIRATLKKLWGQKLHPTNDDVFNRNCLRNDRHEALPRKCRRIYLTLLLWQFQ